MHTRPGKKQVTQTRNILTARNYPTDRPLDISFPFLSKIQLPKNIHIELAKNVQYARVSSTLYESVHLKAVFDA